MPGYVVDVAPVSGRSVPTLAVAILPNDHHVKHWATVDDGDEAENA
jgi:hypothetical protein